MTVTKTVQKVSFTMPQNPNRFWGLEGEADEVGSVEAVMGQR